MNRRKPESERTTALEFRREWLLYLLAGQPRRRVSYRRFVKRATRMFSITWKGAGYSDKQIRECVRYDLQVLANLRPSGAVRLEKPCEGSQFRYVVLSRSGARRWLWAVYAKTVLRITATARSASVRRIADALGRHERTVWRWFAGDAVPGPANARALIRFFVQAGLPPGLPPRQRAAGLRAFRRIEPVVFEMLGRGLLDALEREMSKRGFTEREKARSLEYIEERLLKGLYGLHGATLREGVP